MMIIDGHSHFGEDFFHGQTYLHEYQALLDKCCINYGLVMPTANPIDTKTNKRYLCWKINDNKIEYYSERGDLLENPYMDVNYSYYQRIQAKKDRRLFFVPLIHPMLDTITYLEELVDSLNPVALKIHGIGGGIDPYQIPEDFSRFVSEHNLMLIVHGDFDNGKMDTRYDTLLLRNLNVPYRWANYFIKSNILGVINHGAALDEETMEIINQNKNVMVALGPSAIIQADVDRLMWPKSQVINEGYLPILKKSVNYKKIIFDIDFDWNILPGTKNMDFGFIDAVKEVWDKENEQEQIFGRNLLLHSAQLKEQISDRETK